MDWRRVRRRVRVVWVSAGLLFTAWMVWAFQSHGVPDGTFASDGEVEVLRADGSWSFRPRGQLRGVGLVFLPGGMVDPRAYGPLARALAGAGYPVALVELPMRMARTPADEQTVSERAGRARATLGANVSWVLGGHSRGAAIATRLIAAEAGAYRGLALIGTTHPRSDLSGLALPVLKVGGTRDCVAPRDGSEQNVGNLPATTEWLWIEGANHAQFGWYGPQLGDCNADISRDAQQGELLEALARFLDRIGDAAS